MTLLHSIIRLNEFHNCYQSTLSKGIACHIILNNNIKTRLYMGIDLNREIEFRFASKSGTVKIKRMKREEMKKKLVLSYLTVPER